MIDSMEKIDRLIGEQQAMNRNCEIHLQCLRDYKELLEKLEVSETSNKELLAHLVKSREERAALRKENGYLEAFRMADQIEINGLRAATKQPSAVKIRKAAASVGTVKIPGFGLPKSP